MLDLIQLKKIKFGALMKNKIFIGSLIFLSLLFSCSQYKEKNLNNELTTIGYQQEIHKKMTLHKGKERTGLFVYELTCKGCHGKNTQGAPLPGDKLDWNPRLKQGMGQLLNHTVNGLGDYMPAKGGCLDCRPEELLAAIKYMIELPKIRYDF